LLAPFARLTYRSRMLPDGAALRQIMRHYPTGVVVITAPAPDGPRGMTAGSFASISLDPALVGFNVMNSSRLHGALREGSAFAVNILGDHQAPISAWFAKPGLSSAEQFAGMPHRLDGQGSPWLDGCLGWLSCRVRELAPGGDHAIVIGELLGTELGDEGRPLLFYGGGYHRIGDLI
jgi:flavin reductase (DIM6/NTAB) family NADH-FMN oxidoreductase RutF